MAGDDYSGPRIASDESYQNDPKISSAKLNRDSRRTKRRQDSADRSLSSTRSKSHERLQQSPLRANPSKSRSSRHRRRSFSEEFDGNEENDDKKYESGSRRSRRSRSKTDSRKSRHATYRESRSASKSSFDDKPTKEVNICESDKASTEERSKSHDKDSTVTEKSLDNVPEENAPKRKRRTGWDANPPAGITPAVAPGTLAPALTPTSTGFTASLAGRTPEEAVSMATSLQLKATASQLCRIYVGSLDYSLTDQDIRQVFSAFGTITSIDMPKEGTRSKGFCFIEYGTPESAEMALSTMPGFNLKGRAIKVGRPTALGGQAASTLPLTNVARVGGVNAAEAGQIAAAMLLARSEGQSMGFNAMDDAQNRVYVGNIPPNFTADDIKQIFQCFGKILSCQLIPNSEKPGTHRGYGFIEFGTYEAAKTAIDSMNNFQIAGKSLKVNYATVMRGLNAPSVSPTPSSSFAGIMPASATGANAVPVQQLLQGTTSSILGDPDNAASPLSASTSHGAMSNTLPSGMMDSSTSAAQTPAVPSTPTSSPVLLLSNMVDPQEANDDLKEEIRHECSRYGSIIDISLAVDAQQQAVRIFVVFADPSHAAGAVPMLHDRWFGGRRIHASLYNQNSYIAGSLWL